MNDCFLLILLFLSLWFFTNMNHFNERKINCLSKTLLPPKAYTLKEIFRFAILLSSFLSGILRDHNYITQTQKTYLQINIANKYLVCC